MSWAWPSNVNTTQLELYNVTPIFVVADQPQSFANLASLASRAPNVTVTGPGLLTISFGTESAAWLEFDSPDLPDDVLTTMLLSLSETSEPMPTKSLLAVPYGRTYRLETNPQIYEGLRFGFINITLAPSRPFHITAVRAVAQTLPVAYLGSFESVDDPMLTRTWYTGAYCPKLNMVGPPLPGAVPPSVFMLDAILISRGDRIGWTGDDHVAQGAIMHAFGQFEFVRQNLWNTHNDSNSILSYSLYWCMSVLEYYNATADADTLELYYLNIDAKLEQAVQLEGSPTAWGARGPWQPAPLSFFGWDERLGAGFENASCIESQRDYSMLTIRA